MEFQWTDDLVYEYTQSSLTMNEFKQSKMRKPIFISEDGISLYALDDFWSVGMRTFIIRKGTVEPTDYDDGDNICKFFSTEGAAKEYVLYNKSCLSLNDVRNSIILNDCELIALTRTTKNKL